MSKSWTKDGEDAVIQEMIDNARAGPDGFAQRGIMASEPHPCEVCHKPIRAWTTYHITCYIEDGEPIFVRHHIFCPGG